MSRVLRQIERLDPERDHQRIVLLLARQAFLSIRRGRYLAGPGVGMHFLNRGARAFAFFCASTLPFGQPGSFSFMSGEFCRIRKR